MTYKYRHTNLQNNYIQCIVVLLPVCDELSKLTIIFFTMPDNTMMNAIIYFSHHDDGLKFSVSSTVSKPKMTIHWCAWSFFVFLYIFINI